MSTTVSHIGNVAYDSTSMTEGFESHSENRFRGTLVMLVHVALIYHMQR